MIGYGSIRFKRGPESEYAPVVELADTLDLGSSGRPCRFKSCQAHHRRRSLRTAQKTRFRKSRVFFDCAPGLLLSPSNPLRWASMGSPVFRIGSSIFFDLPFHIKRTTCRSVPAVSVRAARTPLNGVLFLFRLRPASLCSKAGGVSALGAGIFFLFPSMKSTTFACRQMWCFSMIFVSGGTGDMPSR